MADRTKFEKMLELLINEDREAAEALFHEIVVEKSRDIYESLLEDDAEIEEESDEEVDESDDEEVDESDDELDESEDEEVDESDDDDVDEGFNLDEFEVEADPMSMMGGDATDDMIGDVGMDDEGGDMDMDMGDEGDVNDRMDDLEDALEALKAEFEAMMGGEGDEEGEEEEEGEGDEEEEDEEEKESFMPAFEAKKSEKKDEKKVKKSATEEMREYVEKIGGQTYNTYGKMGDNGANTKSIVAGKNDMGGTSSNITSAGTEKSPVEANKGQLKGSGLLKGSPKDMSTKNVNVPGGKAGVKHLSKKSGGGLDNNSILKTDHSDKSAQSTLNKVSTRAK
jgi:hypothetical protein